MSKGGQLARSCGTLAVSRYRVSCCTGNQPNRLYLDNNPSIPQRLPAPAHARTAPNSHPRVTSCKISPNVYHLVNMMCRFIFSISYPLTPFDPSFLTAVRSALTASGTFWAGSGVLWGCSSAPDRVKWLSPNHRFVIALHSPDGLVETGQLMGPPEKKVPSLACWGQAGHSLRSGFRVRVAELRRFRAVFRGLQFGFSATQTVWRRGRDSITAVSAISL